MLIELSSVLTLPLLDDLYGRIRSVPRDYTQQHIMLFEAFQVALQSVHNRLKPSLVWLGGTVGSDAAVVCSSA